MALRKREKKVAEEPMPKRYRINRDATIYSMRYDDNMCAKDISLALEVSESCVRHTIARIDAVKENGTVKSYFTMAYGLCEELEKIGQNPDRVLTRILNGLWANGINTPSKLKKLSPAGFEELFSIKRLKRLEIPSQIALRNYRASLKTKAVAK